ncbi:hypothetical protein Tsp_05580 [Trichinella spiralis]|uniref:hypothetical protein n=1 Tax=Trichinella spiralis TaxID=6334 RepID=UPI0001EFDF92|nr:hypothetical protein Tsp_05580 [Trichinella spiralis]
MDKSTGVSIFPAMLYSNQDFAKFTKATLTRFNLRKSKYVENCPQFSVNHNTGRRSTFCHGLINRSNRRLRFLLASSSLSRKISKSEFISFQTCAKKDVCVFDPMVDWWCAS